MEGMRWGEGPGTPAMLASHHHSAVQRVEWLELWCCHTFVILQAKRCGWPLSCQDTLRQMAEGFGY